MGVHPSSIYAAFGDKRALFALAAKRYADVAVECMVKALRLQAGATTERRIKYATSRTINRHDTERCRIRLVVPSIHPGGRMSLASATIRKTGRADDPDLMFGDLCASALQPMPIYQKYEHGFRNRILVGSTEIKMELSAV